MSEVLTGRVIKVINDYEIVIDKGSNDEVKSAYRFLVYPLMMRYLTLQRMSLSEGLKLCAEKVSLSTYRNALPL